MSKLADVANNTIIKTGAGKNQNPTFDTLKKISKALDVSVDELIK
ncbi:helix-turn-helix transcriptional regulator [Patescibacteria group bacterium]|nr:helix-turn-helix transcriptional regulator [Patescibacteria group bacterium]MBU4480730.1 helix-turn-helix transcriptional regulator [Patescibacteria group bacterium]